MMFLTRQKFCESKGLSAVNPVVAKQTGINDGNGALDFSHQCGRHTLAFVK